MCAYKFFPLCHCFIFILVTNVPFSAVLFSPAPFLSVSFSLCPFFFFSPTLDEGHTAGLPLMITYSLVTIKYKDKQKQYK